MPRRSAYLICLPNRSAFGATSHGMPRARSAVATAVERARLSSSVTATSTAAGVRREVVRPRLSMSRWTRRDTPIEIPTPGYVVRPSEASES